MEVSITQFRQDIFDLVSQALNGSEIWVTYKGRRFRITPETLPASRLERITPLKVVNQEDPELNDKSLQNEMTQAWEKDWSDL
jgi:antitoxin (DNA-binding transcriptional repressor) of toxin-antitoxin stability system